MRNCRELRRQALPSVLAITLPACGAAIPTAPSGATANMRGVWDVTFSGIVEETGAPHRDSLVLEIRQQGTTASGIARFEGMALTLPFSGTLIGNSVRYVIRGPVAPGCEASFVGEATVDASAGRVNGYQRQSICAGTAVGPITGLRR